MSGTAQNPTTRFSSRVDDYVKYRPGYPGAILDFLRHECGLTRDSIIADVGSGTGKLTELFLKNGNQVFGIEPNQEMREAGERLLKPYPNFRSLAATAEATTLQNQSVDIITAGQAFHWFNRETTRQEFLRILKPGGWVALIWNDRHTTASPFLEAYEELLQKFSTDYRAVDHKNVDSTVIGEFSTPQATDEVIARLYDVNVSANTEQLIGRQTLRLLLLLVGVGVTAGVERDAEDGEVSEGGSLG